MKAELSNEAVERAPGYRWWALTLAVLAQSLVQGAAWTVMPVLFLEISQPQPVGLGLSLVELGAIWGIFSLAMAFFSIPMGIAGDRFGVRWVVGFGLILTAVGCALRATAGGFTSLLVWMFLFGVGNATLGPNVPKLIGTWFPPKQLGVSNGIALGSYGLGAGLAIQFGGSVISPAVGGWRNLFWIFGAIVLAIGLLWLLTARDQKKPAPSAHAAGSVVAGQQALFHSMAVALRTRDVWWLVTAQVVYVLGFLGALGFLPMYLVGKGLSQATANGCVSILLYLFVAGAIIVPMISDRLGSRRWVYFVSISLNGLAVMATAFVTGPALVMAFAVWGFTTGGVILSFVVPLEHPQVGPGLAGATLGLLMAMGSLGGSVGPVMGNAVAAQAGGTTAIVLWGACYVAAAFIFLLVKETHPRRSRFKAAIPGACSEGSPEVMPCQVSASQNEI